MIISAAICAAILFGVCGVFVVKFSHPDDEGQAKFPKLVVVMSLWLAAASVLVVPFDIATVNGTFRTDILWEIIYIAVGVFVFGLIPYAYFFYESDVNDEEVPETCCATQTGAAFGYALAFFLIFGAILVVMYTFLGEANVPYTLLRQELSTVYDVSPEGVKDKLLELTPGCWADCTREVLTVNFRVTLPVYLIGLLSFLGWFFFSIFAGVGLMALPMDLINEFRTRPRPMSTAAWVEGKRRIGQRASALLVFGEDLKARREASGEKSSKKRRDERKRMLQFEKHFYFLKSEYEVLCTAYKLKGGNPVWYFFKLFLGLFAVVISVSWVLHILLFVMPEEPTNPFLNNFFIYLVQVYFYGPMRVVR